MPHIDSHLPGSFCWFELCTSDQAAAKRFYGGLFGWSVQDHPMGPEAYYTMFRLEGRDVAGGYQLDPKQYLGVPPHWATYIQVEDADAAAERARSLGGKLIVDPFDVFDLGRMATLQDPTCAYFCLWQPKKHTGSGIAGVPGTVCWSELATADPEKARDFYTQLFAWETYVGGESNYIHIKVGGKDAGGILPLSSQGAGVPPHWMPYFLSADCDATAGRAKELGGDWFMPPTTMPNVGRFAVLKDPQGAVFSVIQVTQVQPEP
ncbi:MAG: VOC family protein [Acidobacteriota bacterium]